MTRLIKKPKTSYRYLLRVWPCRSLIYIYFGCGGRNNIFCSLKKCKSHRWTWFAAAPREFFTSEKTSVMMFKFPNIIGIKNRYFFFENDLIQIFFYAGCTAASLYDDQTCWKHPWVYYSFKFYNVTSFCLSRALKAKTYEKSHNLWQ